MKSTTLLSARNPNAGNFKKNMVVKIDTPFDNKGRKLYRCLYYLHFVVDPSSAGIIIDKKSSLFAGYFDDYNLKLTANNLNFQTQSWLAIKEQDDSSPNLVKVHLTHPWRLQSVSTNDGRGVEVLRLDGDAMSEQPTISGNANTLFVDEFTGQDFSLRKVTAFPLSSPIKKSSDKKQSILTMTAENRGDVEIEGYLQEGAVDAIKETVAVASHGIKSINLKSLPTGPRISLGEIGQVPALEDTLLKIWQEAGEQAHLPVPFFKDFEGLQAALHQIQMACDRYFASLSASSQQPAKDLYLPIIFESDTPACLRLNELEIEYGLLLNQFDNINSQPTLKFTGKAIETQQLSISLPPDSMIIKATLTLNNGLKNGFNLADASALTNTLGQHIGVDMITGVTVANCAANAEAQQVECIALAILPLEEASKARLQLVQDVNNGPKGSILAQTEIELPESHARQWAVAKFPAPVLLDSGPYWMSLTVLQGHMFWLGETGNGIVHIQQNGKVDKKVNSLELLYHPGFSPPKPGNMSDVAILVDAISAKVVEQISSKCTFDLTAALHEHYSSDSPGPALVNFSSGSKGNLTLKTVEVIYELFTN